MTNRAEQGAPWSKMLRLVAILAIALVVPAVNAASNVATSGTATMSSIYLGQTSSGPQVCNDGNTGGSLCHSNQEANFWWQVAWGSALTVPVHSVILYNRWDGGGASGSGQRTPPFTFTIRNCAGAVLLTSPTFSSVLQIYTWTLTQANKNTVQAGGGACRVRYQRGGSTSTYLNFHEVEVIAGDDVDPVVTCPAAQTSVEATSASGATIVFSATATDDYAPANPTATCDRTSGVSFFPIGSTVLQCSATDGAGNVGTCDVTMTVVDTTPPALVNCPVDQTVGATSSAGALITYSAGAFSATDAGTAGASIVLLCTSTGSSEGTVSKSVAGDSFPLGASTLTCQATDAAGLVTTCPSTATITVQDTTVPTVTCPAAQTVESTDANGAVITYTATAADTISANTPTASCTGAPDSGNVFSIGTHTLSCTANDGVNTSPACTVDMRVMPLVEESVTDSAGGSVAVTWDGVVATVTVPADATGAAGAVSYNMQVRNSALYGATGAIVSVALSDAPTNTPAAATPYDYSFTLTTGGGETLAKPLVFTLDLSSLNPTNPPALYYYDTTSGSEGWKDASTTCEVPFSSYDATTKILTVHVCHLTQFAVFDVGACAFEESRIAPTSVAIDTSAATFTGTTWTVDMTIPGHWNNVSLTSPTDCGGGSWSCGGAAVPDASCNRSVTCSLSGWVPPSSGDDCNKTVGPNGEDVYVLAPMLQATVPVEGGNSRDYEQIIALGISYQTLVNATASFDSLGDSLNNFYISKGLVTGFNENAQLQVEVTTTLSWPYEFIVDSTLDDFTDGSTTDNDDLQYTLDPNVAKVALSCGTTQDDTCTQVLSFAVTSQTAACRLNNIFTLRLTEVCRTGVDAEDCSLSPTGPKNSTVTVTVNTGSVCINSSISVTLDTETTVVRNYDKADGTGVVPDAFYPYGDIYFKTVVNSTNGQFVQNAKPVECYLDGLGQEGSLFRAMKFPTLGSGAGTAAGVDYCASGCTDTAPKDNGVLQFKAEPGLWLLTEGTRRTMSMSCQYTVTVAGVTRRRRLLQVGGSSTTSTPYVRGDFTIANQPQPAGPGPAASSSSSALVVSPTVAAAAVLAVAAAVLVVVAVRRRKTRRERNKTLQEDNKEMVQLQLPTSSSQATLTVDHE